ncbi:TolC family protein [Novosphingobium sp. AP12]|uniref:TolC family protein n=1 Tax=Novosphingobium sp. AP12 TaxID=1144305 RepID=UPI00027219F9|nr:TolC family protein [Novosphingobium sp. AP12]EJL27971.1 outer membrane protein [Novosphingobium sp. AP12]
MHRFLTAMLAVLCCASAATAQEGRPALTLARALDLAALHSPAAQAGEATVGAARAARTAAGLRPNPALSVQTENIAGNGLYRGFSSAETTLQFTLPLERGGKRSARIRLADRQQERALVEQTMTVADLELAVTRAYVGAAAAQRRAQIASRQVDIAADAFHAAQVRVRAGRASPLEEQRGQLMLLNAQATLEQSQRLEALALGNLALQIGAPVDAPLDEAWFERLAPAGPERRVPVEATLAARAAALDVASAEAQVRLVEAHRVPDVQLFAGPRRFEASDDTALMVGLTIPLQVFDNGSAALAQAQAERQKADAVRRMANIALAQAIASADAEVANAQTAARIASGAALEAATEAARIARIGYREGKFGQVDLLDAERTLAATRFAAVDALAAYHDALARRDRLVAPAPLPTED